MSDLCRASRTAGKGINSRAHIYCLPQHSRRSEQLGSSSLETSTRACTSHFSEQTFLHICSTLDTAEGVHIVLPSKHSQPSGSGGDYSATRGSGESVTIEPPKMMGQVRHYFKIIQMTATMLSGAKCPSLKVRCDLGSQASPSEPCLGNTVGHQVGDTICGHKLGVAVKY